MVSDETQFLNSNSKTGVQDPQCFQPCVLCLATRERPQCSNMSNLDLTVQGPPDMFQKLFTIYVALTFRQAGSWLSTEVSCIVIILKIVCYNNENTPDCQVEVTCPAKKNSEKLLNFV